MFIDFEGKKIEVKEYGCNMGDIPAHRIAPCVNIFVKVTSACQAGCSFCSNAGSDLVPAAFNVGKLVDLTSRLARAGITINKVNITGGEPSLVPDLVESILDAFSIEEISDIHMHLNTNGLLPQSQALMRHPRWDSISISMHHYDHAVLSEIYHSEVPSSALDFSGIDKMKMNVSCNLIKGYIDSAEMVHRMLDFCIDREISRIGFVSLMLVNDWCRNHFVDFRDIDMSSIPHVYFTRSMDRGENCRCSNYLYNRDGKVLEIYYRHYVNHLRCESSLVYDGEFFRQGFGKDNILF